MRLLLRRRLHGLAIAMTLLGWTACGPPLPAGAEPAAAVPATRPVGLALGLTFEDDVDDEAVTRRWQALVGAVSQTLWRASEGQLYVRGVTFEDRASWGHLRVPQGALELEVLASGAAFELSRPGGERWRIDCPGNPADDERTVLLLAAEVARGVFGLDEHRTPEGAGGPGCLLAGTATRLCADGDVPRLARRSCRSVVDERWLGLATFPNAGWNAEEPTPATAFERLRETP